MADAPAGNAPAAPAPTPPPAVEAPKKLAPIPPKSAATAAPPAEKFEDRPRDSSGRYTAEELINETGGDDPADYPKTTLDGMASEELDAPAPRVTKKQRAKDMFTPVIEGEEKGEEAAPASAPEPGLEGEDAPPPPQPEPAPEVPAAPAKFRFAGQDWDSAERAEQEFKTYRGRYLRTQQLETSARSNHESAAAWKARAEAAEAKLAPHSDPKSGPAPNGTAAPENGDEPLNKIDWNIYKSIQEQHGDSAATLWATEQGLKAERKRVDALIENVTRPQKEHAELVEHANGAGETMSKLATEFPGEFPEFEDDSALEVMGQFLTTRNQEGVPWSYLKSPRGVYETVLAYRAYQAQTTRSAAPPAPPTPTAVQRAVESVRQANPTLSGRSAPVRPAPPNEAEGSRVKRAILGAKVSNEYGWSE